MAEMVAGQVQNKQESLDKLSTGSKLSSANPTEEKTLPEIRKQLDKNKWANPTRDVKEGERRLDSGQFVWKEGQGNENSGVRDVVARRLQEKGYLADGTHADRDVAAAVRKFQKDSGLNDDGIVGRKTWNNLRDSNPVVKDPAVDAQKEKEAGVKDAEKHSDKSGHLKAEASKKPEKVQHDDGPVISGKTAVEVKAGLGAVDVNSSVVTPGMALGTKVTAEVKPAASVEAAEAAKMQNVPAAKSASVDPATATSNGTRLAHNTGIDPMMIGSEIWNRNSSTAHMPVNRKMVIDSLTANQLLPEKPTSGYSNKEIEDGVKAFQSLAGFKETGVVDLVTMDRMRNSSDLHVSLFSKVLNKLW